MQVCLAGTVGGRLGVWGGSGVMRVTEVMGGWGSGIECVTAASERLVATGSYTFAFVCRHGMYVFLVNCMIWCMSDLRLLLTFPAPVV
jgi:hypothetical protein